MTKQTLKVLTGMALAGTLVATGAHNADAKFYKTEARLEGDKETVILKTNDPEAKGKTLFGVFVGTVKDKKGYASELKETKNYQGQEIKTLLQTGVGYELTYQPNNDTFFVLSDDELGEHNERFHDDSTGGLKDSVYQEVKKIGSKTYKELQDELGKQKTQTSTKPQTQPQQGQNKNNELVKDQKKKQEGVKRAEETQKQQTLQVEKKIDTAKKPLPKTNASSNTGLATFGGLSLISLMVFLGLRKKQK